MKNVDITISVAEDGFYSAYCNDYPALFGSGDTPESAIDELRETLKITKELGRDSALWDNNFSCSIHRSNCVLLLSRKKCFKRCRGFSSNKQ